MDALIYGIIEMKRNRTLNGILDRLFQLSTCNNLTHQYFGDDMKLTHYENTPIQIYWKFYNQKLANFQIKNSNIFHISAQNIDCGYSLEPPRRGGSNEYLQSMFEQK